MLYILSRTAFMLNRLSYLFLPFLTFFFIPFDPREFKMFNQNFNKLKYFLHCSRQQEQIHRPSEATLPKPFYRSRISTSTKECKHESLLTHLFFELKISVKMKKNSLTFSPRMSLKPILNTHIRFHS